MIQSPQPHKVPPKGALFGGWLSWRRVGILLAAVVVLWVPFSTGLLRTPKELRSAGKLGHKTPPPQGLKLHILHHQNAHAPWTLLKPGTTLSSQGILGFRYSLHRWGGYAAIFWARPEKGLVCLYQSKKVQRGGRFFLARSGRLLAQHRLRREPPGAAFLFLVQSHKVLSKAQRNTWSQQMLASPSTAGFLAQLTKTQKNSLLVTHPFALTITSQATNKQR